MKILTLMLLFALASVAAAADFWCVALYPSPVTDPRHKDLEPRILAFFAKQKMKIQAAGSATVWISVSEADFPKARVALIEAVRKKEFEPVVVFVPEAWKKRADGVSYYDFKYAEDFIRKETEPIQSPQTTTGSSAPDRA
jgi:hypothetical protein